MDNSIDTNINIDSTFDVRDYMNYDRIKLILLGNPTEMALLEITCILINNNIKKKYCVIPVSSK
jgi:hypothetical protein